MPKSYSQLAKELNLTPIYENEAQLVALRNWCADHFFEDSNNLKTSWPKDEYQVLQKQAEEYLDLFPLHNSDLNTPNSDLAGYTPIQWAALKGYKEFLKQHINNVDPVNERTPLHLAASYGKLSVVHFLLKHGAKNTADRGGEYPIHLALALNIIEQTPSLKEKSIQTRTAIYRLLKAAKPESLQKTDAEGRNIAHHMVVYGFNKLLNELITAKSKLLLARDSLGLTPAHLAIRTGQTSSLTLLLKDERIQKLSDEKGTLLHYAADAGSKDDIMACLKAGIDEHGQDNNKRTPAMRAVLMGNDKALPGFNIESLSKERFGENELTLLHLATKNNIGASQKWLSENTELPSVRDKKGLLPEDYNSEQNLLISRMAP
ncbi:MAG: ankyrin repeat domain-containing protein [Legionella sp.]|uniref:ankyrin repeat domain-containing protein n=1 Tax=Legionella sp. TaxID=459 RepID=UPI00284F8E2C|nr:ankyrin repeat domain-containing protein [Legionella sp.]